MHALLTERAVVISFNAASMNSQQSTTKPTPLFTMPLTHEHIPYLASVLRAVKCTTLCGIWIEYSVWLSGPPV
jgi:hypothetical protein